MGYDTGNKVVKKQYINYVCNYEVNYIKIDFYKCPNIDLNRF